MMLIQLTLLFCRSSLSFFSSSPSLYISRSSYYFCFSSSMASENISKKIEITNDVTTTTVDGVVLLESLPGDIVTDIFSRLPISSFLKLNLVSKSLRSLLTQHSYVPSNPCLLLHCDYPIRNNLHFLDLSEEDKDIKTKKFSLGFSSSMAEFDIVGSCNGMLCLSDSLFKDSLYIYNPFTTKSLELPRWFKKYQNQEIVFGFGFNQKTKEYKVLKMVYFESKSEVEILTLTSRKDQSLSWRHKGFVPYRFMKNSSEAVVNGRLHFVTMPSKFVSFDLEDEEFRVIPKQKTKLGYINRANHRLVNLKGCLCTVVYTKNRETNIWVMKKYGVKESWSKEYSIRDCLSMRLRKSWRKLPKWIHKNAEDRIYVRVLCMLENGEILLEHRNRVLVAFDPNLGTFRELNFVGLPDLFHTVVHVGTLSWFDDTCLDL